MRGYRLGVGGHARAHRPGPVILRLAGEDGRNQVQDTSRPGGQQVLIELVPGNCLDQAVHPDPALGSGREQAGTGQGASGLGPLQAIAQCRGQAPGCPGRARSQDVQVDFVWVEERAKP